VSDEAFKVRGAEDFLRLSKALKGAGALDLRKELHREMSKAARPLIPQARAAARLQLPQRGGLAARIAKKTPIRAQVRTGVDTAGVRITAGKRRSAAWTADQLGYVWHPVYGNRKAWARTCTREGWFSSTLDANSAKAIRPAIEAAMGTIAAKVITNAKG